MKYQFMRKLYLFEALIILLAPAAAFAIIGFPRPGEAGWFSFLTVAVLCAAMGLVFLYLAFRSKAYAMIRDDGVHVLSPQKDELVFIPWEDVRDCRWGIHIRRGSSMMLIFRYDATFLGKPLATYQGNPIPSDKEAEPYRLDGLMYKLERGTMTAEEVRALPILLLYMREKPFQKCYSMWRTAKTRAAEQEGTT
jgi:hypothetical protein